MLAFLFMLYVHMPVRITTFNLSLRYWVNVNGVRLECCRETFMDIHKVKRRTVSVLQTRLQNGEVGVVDKRGTHNNRPRNVNPDIKAMMLDHIREYPLENVHYSRRHENDRYLPPNLTVSLMFREFKNANPNIHGLDNKEWLYRSVFKEAKIRIGQPKTDTCTQCDIFVISKRAAVNPIEEELITQQHHHHLLNADNGYRAMYSDIESSRNPNNNLVVKCIDMQQVSFSV